MKKPQVFQDSRLERFETSDGRGYGVRATAPIAKRTVVTEYRGRLLSKQEAEETEECYERNGDTRMCYTFWFRGKTGQQQCLDATDSKHISKYINHSRKRANVMPVLVRDQEDNDEDTQSSFGSDASRIVFKAMRNIAAGEELLFDYGENRAHVLEANPWLKE